MDHQKQQGLTVARLATGLGSPNSVPGIVHEVLASPGQPLAAAPRHDLEARFGQDFSEVRVHVDARAAESAHAVDARAYTVGRDIVFGAGQYAPQSVAGQRLLAHELTHVMQQGGTSAADATSDGLVLGNPADPMEREAERHAASLVAGGRVGNGTATGELGQTLRRDAKSAGAPPGLSCAPDARPHLHGSLRATFAISSTALSAKDHADIRAFLTSWQASPAKPDVEVHGYASLEGPAALNWRLSCDRAEAVKRELTSPPRPLVGIPASKIKTLMHGATDEFGPMHPSNRAAIAVTAAAAVPAPATAPTCGSAPACPTVAPAPLPRDPHIPSGALCRGACGPDCPPTCTALPPVSICVPDSTGACHVTCIYPAVISCGTHVGCQVHDACYDACAAAGEHDLCYSGGWCHCGCDANCINTHTVAECNSWRTGHGPFTGTLTFSDPPTRSGLLTGSCVTGPTLVPPATAPTPPASPVRPPARPPSPGPTPRRP
jgi:outer membrane protein OmpA-like peptidoglycan-associated protein